MIKKRTVHRKKKIRKKILKFLIQLIYLIKVKIFVLKNFLKKLKNFQNLVNI